MVMDINTFLQLYKVRDATHPLTHLSLNGGKYFIPEDKLEEFYAAYVTSFNNNTPIYLTEKLNYGDKFLFYLDIDFDPEQYEILKAHLNVPSDYHFLLGLQQTVSTVLTQEFNQHITFDDVVISIRLPHKIHINFPTIAVNKRTALMYAEACKNFWKELGVFDEATINKIFDTGVYRSGLRMLGSRKRGGEDWYKVVDFDNSDEMEFVFRPIDLTLFKKTVIRNYAIDDEELEHSNHCVNYEAGNVDQSLFQNYCNDIAGQIALPNISLQIAKIRQGFGTALSYTVLCKDRYCPFVNRPHRRNSDYIYIFITKRGAKLKCWNQECREFSLPLNRPYFPLNAGISGLFRDHDPRYKLSQDDINIIKKFTGQEINQDRLFEISDTLKEDSLDCFSVPTHVSVSKVLFTLLKNKIRCHLDCNRRVEWYELKNHYLQNISHINIHVVKMMIAWSKLVMQIVQTTDPNMENISLDKFNLFISNYNNHNGLLLALANEFTLNYERWRDTLDTKLHLVCYKNGVLDLSTMQFRPGHIDDGITFRLNGNYAEFDPTDIYVQQVLGFFEDLFPCPLTRDYVLKTLAQCLSGFQRPEEYYILTGNGANGKSKLVGLISKTFGSYWEDVPVSLFLYRRAVSNQAQPELMAIKGKRICTIQEPENGSSLNMGIIKQLSGNDTVSGRNLYQSQQSFQPQTSFFMCCNNVPNISDSDGGTWRRIKIITMKSQFVANPRLPFQKPIDYELDKKMEMWPDAFLSVLLHYYQLSKIQKKEESPDMIADQNEIRKDVDFINQFIETKLISIGYEQYDDEEGPEAANEIEYLALDQIYAAYTLHCKEHDAKVHSKINFRRALKEKFRQGQNDLFACQFRSNNNEVHNN